MSRYATGVTLNSKERTTKSKTQPGETKTVSTHCCEIVLPDGRPCQVSYRRQGPCSHEFDYGDPVNQRVWFAKRLEPGASGVEKKASELAPEAFRKASEQERKEMQRSLTLTEARARQVDLGPEMDTKAAALCAGRYAPCVSFASGRLLRIGGLYDTPEAATQEIASGQHRSVRLMNGQQLVVGICSRSERRWVTPRFPAVVAGTPEVAADTAGPEAGSEFSDETPCPSGPA